MGLRLGRARGRVDARVVEEVAGAVGRLLHAGQQIAEVGHGVPNAGGHARGRVGRTHRAHSVSVRVVVPAGQATVAVVLERGGEKKNVAEGAGEIGGQGKHQKNGESVGARAGGGA